MGALSVITENKYVKLGYGLGALVYGYVTERLWPVYSTGMVVGTLMLIASMHEKQTIADHFFGHKAKVTNEEVEEAQQLMDDELHRAVKRDVYRMPASKFHEEARALQSA